MLYIGPNTQNYEWAAWGEWSECSVSCGGEGIKTRTRACIPPSYGGYECPSTSQTETDTCALTLVQKITLYLCFLNQPDISNCCI